MKCICTSCHDPAEYLLLRHGDLIANMDKSIYYLCIQHALEFTNDMWWYEIIGKLEC